MQPCDRLTSKEIQVAMLVWEGQTNREIASVIGTTEQVVKNYLRNTFDKVGVWSRLELALYVAAHGGAAWRKSAVSPPTLDPSVKECTASSQQTEVCTSGQTEKNDPRPMQLGFKAKTSPPLISA
jgi:DNA-binding CsgD family transcriptional regulator